VNSPEPIPSDNGVALDYEQIMKSATYAADYASVHDGFTSAIVRRIIKLSSYAILVSPPGVLGYLLESFNSLASKQA
jgi:hypothetical protein